MTQATASTRKVPVPESLDEEVIQFRAQFDERSSLDEIVRRGAQIGRKTDRPASMASFLETLGTPQRLQIIGGEFYDLVSDPQEWRDLYSAPAVHLETRERMTLELLAFLKSHHKLTNFSQRKR